MSVSPSLIPPEWQEKFLLKRIDEQDIELTLEQRNSILQSLSSGTRFVQIGKYTIMLNSIKSIDPKWGDSNIPPRPLPEIQTSSQESTDDRGVKYFKVNEVCTNEDKLKLWDSLFKDKIVKIVVFLVIFLLSSNQSANAATISKHITITSKYVTQHPVQLKTPVKTQQIASPTRLKGETPKQGSVLPVTSTVRNQQHPAPVYAPLPEFKKEVARKIKLAFPDDAREMIAIAMAESGLRCEAINHMDSNGVQSVGLFQINDGRLFDDNDIANLTNCDHNMTRAKQKYATQTKRAWGAFTNGAYQRYLWIFDEI